MANRQEAQDAKDQLKAAIDRAHKIQARSVEQMDDRSLGLDVHQAAAKNHRQASIMVDELAPKLFEVEQWLQAHNSPVP